MSDLESVEGLFYVAKTKALISCAVTAQLICAFVFAYEKNSFSHDVALIFDRFYINSPCIT